VRERKLDKKDHHKFEQVNRGKVLQKEVHSVLVVQQTKTTVMWNQWEAKFRDVAEHRIPVILVIHSVEALVHRQAVPHG
jgi:hypothetical protein